MKLFRRTKDEVTTEEAGPRYLEGRSWNGSALHLLEEDHADDHIALCGYETLDHKSAVHVDAIVRGLEFEHAGWHYCRRCLAEAGIAAEPR